MGVLEAAQSFRVGSLVPRPFEEEEEKGPGTHCLRMLRYPKNLRRSDTTVYFLIYLPFDLYSSRFREKRMAGLDGSIFERDFEAACCHANW